MAYAEDLYNRLTSGMAGSDQYLAKLSDRGQPSEAEMARLTQARQVPSLDVTKIAENVANQVGSPNLRGAMGAVNAMGAMGEAMTPQPMSNMMTPEDQAAYLQSFTDAGINLTPGAGIARGLLNMDQAITNATTAPGNLGMNQLQNIAGGQSNVSPYGLGLGQQMYNPEMLRGLLGF